MQRHGMRHLIQHVFCAITIALCAASAPAASIADLVRIRGMEQNVVIGMGVVVGLDGTGDTSKESQLAARPFAELMRSLGNPVSDLGEVAESDSYAIVAVVMTVPAAGAHVGDRFDVHVDKLFNAKSLEGGYLLPSLLRLPGPDDPNAPVMAQASGPLVSEPGDAASAIVRGGGHVLADLRNRPVVNDAGYMWLSIKDHYATWSVAATLAESINEPEDFGSEVGGMRRMARVIDAKTIRIRVPEPDRADPANFIAWLTSIPIDTSLIDLPARVVINERRGIIVVTGDVEIDPIAIAHANLDLSTAVAGGADGGSWVGLDPTDGTSRESARLIDLLAGLRNLRVSVADQISIIEEMKDAGVLHAEVIIE